MLEYLAIFIWIERGFWVAKCASQSLVSAYSQASPALAAAEALGEGEEEFAKVVVGLVDFKGVGMEHVERLVLLVAGGGQQFVNNVEVGAVGIVNENVGAG